MMNVNIEKAVIETPEFILRQMTKADLPALAAILKNPLVMYAYEHEFTDEDVREWLARQSRRYEEYGFGLWALELRAEKRMVGQAGLTMQPFGSSQVLEIGYLLNRDYWHKGLATKAAAACRDYAFDTLCADKVHSCIKSDNLASMRVAERIGMKKEAEYIARYYNGDMLHFLYSMKKGDRKS